MRGKISKIGVLILMVIYTITASGFHLVLHYCEGEVAFYGINGKLSSGADECCVDEDILALPVQAEINEEDCCQNKADYIKIKDVQLQSQNLNNRVPPVEWIEYSAIQNYICDHCIANDVKYNSRLNNDSGPPYRGNPDFIVFRNLRI